MTTAYTPDPGSLAARVCTWLQRNRDEELTPRDIATKFDVPVQGLHFTLREAMHHGWITRQGSNGAYAAGPLLPSAGAPGGEPAQPAPAAPPQAPGGKPRRSHSPPDPDAVPVKGGVPVPPKRTGPGGAVYHRLLARMKAGDMVELTKTQAHSLCTAARGLRIKTALRVLPSGATGVWRLE